MRTKPLIPPNLWYQTAKDLAENGGTIEDFAKRIGRKERRVRQWLTDCAPELLPDLKANRQNGKYRLRAQKIAKYQAVGWSIYTRKNPPTEISSGGLNKWVRRNKRLIEQERKKLGSPSVSSTHSPAGDLGLVARD